MTTITTSFHPFLSDTTTSNAESIVVSRVYQSSPQPTESNGTRDSNSSRTKDPVYLFTFAIALGVLIILTLVVTVRAFIFRRMVLRHAADGTGLPPQGILAWMGLAPVAGVTARRGAGGGWNAPNGYDDDGEDEVLGLGATSRSNRNFVAKNKPVLTEIWFEHPSNDAPAKWELLKPFTTVAQSDISITSKVQESNHNSYDQTPASTPLWISYLLTDHPNMSTSTISNINPSPSTPVATSSPTAPLQTRLPLHPPINRQPSTTSLSQRIGAVILPNPSLPIPHHNRTSTLPPSGLRNDSNHAISTLGLDTGRTIDASIMEDVARNADTSLNRGSRKQVAELDGERRRTQSQPSRVKTLVGTAVNNGNTPPEPLPTPSNPALIADQNKESKRGWSTPRARPNQKTERLRTGDSDAQLMPPATSTKDLLSQQEEALRPEILKAFQFFDTGVLILMPDVRNSASHYCNRTASGSGPTAAATLRPIIHRPGTQETEGILPIMDVGIAMVQCTWADTREGVMKFIHQNGIEGDVSNAASGSPQIVSGPRNAQVLPSALGPQRDWQLAGSGQAIRSWRRRRR